MKKQSVKKAKKKVSFIPKGYHSVTPYLACGDAASAIDFYKKAFGAAEIMRMPSPGGRIGHAEIQIGDSRVMLTDEYAAMDFLGPKSRGGTTVHIHVYQFYGDRTGSLEDPFGHVWHIATHKEDLSRAEMKKRSEKAMKDMGGGAD